MSFADQNGVSCFVDQNGLTCFLDQNGLLLCCGGGSTLSFMLALRLRLHG